MPLKKKKETSKTPARKTPKPRVKAKAPAKSAAKLRSKVSLFTAKKTTSAPADVSGSQSVKKPGRPSRLPRYGQTQLVAFVRDPNCIFTYWEVTPETVEEVRRQLMHEYEGSSMVLRVLKTKLDGTTQLLEEITVNRDEMNRYVNLEGTGGSYVLEIGQRTASGRYLVLARSNSIQTGPQAAGEAGSDLENRMPDGIKDYFSEEIIEQSFEPGKKMFSADLAGHGALHRRRLGPQDRHAASRF
jgi:hypothetical protein